MGSWCPQVEPHAPAWGWGPALSGGCSAVPPAQQDAEHGVSRVGCAGRPPQLGIRRCRRRRRSAAAWPPLLPHTRPRSSPLSAGKSIKLVAKFDEDITETIHITQAALGVNPKAGPHVVFVAKEGQRFAIGTLEAGRSAQFSCDMCFSMEEVCGTAWAAGLP